MNINQLYIYLYRFYSFLASYESCTDDHQIAKGDKGGDGGDDGDDGDDGKGGEDGEDGAANGGSKKMSAKLASGSKRANGRVEVAVAKFFDRGVHALLVRAACITGHR